MVSKVKAGIDYTLGGIAVTPSGEVLKNGRVLRGLYAAGEVTGGLHGTNRLGGNALTEALTFGYIAADSIAAARQEQQLPQVKICEVEFLNPILNGLGINNIDKINLSPNVSQDIKEVKALFWKGLGPVREGGVMEDVLEQARVKWEKTVRYNVSRESFTIELVTALLMMATEAAILREESRGGHYRLDYPGRNDETFSSKFIYWEKGKPGLK